MVSPDVCMCIFASEKYWEMAVRTGVRVVILVLLLDFAVFVVPVALVNALIVLLKQLSQSVYHDK